VTAEEIRAFDLTCVPACRTKSEWVPILLREIAIQLAEYNALFREDVRFRQDAIKRQHEMDRERMQETASASDKILEQLKAQNKMPEPGTVIQSMDGRYGLVLEGGYIKPITEEEAEALIKGEKSVKTQ